MSPRSWKILSAIAVLSLSSAAGAQNYDQLSAIVNGPWHHVPNALGPLEFNKEIAKCRVIAAQTPIDSTTPAVIEIVRWRVIINCLKAGGYEPGAAPALNSAASKKPKIAASVKVAGKGPGISPCSQYNASRSDEKEEHVFFSWGEGFLTAYNMQAKSAEIVELSALTGGQQLQFIRDYCDQHPDKRYVEAVLALIQALRSKQTTNR